MSMLSPCIPHRDSASALTVVVPILKIRDRQFVHSHPAVGFLVILDLDSAVNH